MSRVLVCGGRRYVDYLRVFQVLDEVKPKVVITGAAPGADTLASRWAKEHAVPLIEMPAPWDKYPMAAGPMRNQWMIDHASPSLVIAFPGGRGTADMTRRARAAGIEVRAYQ